MELDEFVRESLASIVKGIHAANAAIREAKFESVSFFELPMGMDKGKGVEFDVAVTSTKEGGGKASAKFHVAVVEGHVGGGGSIVHEHVSRIKFTVFAR
jgi:hypothetical protein